MNNSDPSFFRLATPLFLKPLLARKRSLVSLCLALAALGLSQSLILFFLGPFLRVLLGSGLHQEQILIQDLLPEGLMKLSGLKAGTGIQTSLLIWTVPGALFFAACIRSVALYGCQLSMAAIALYMSKNYRDRFFEALLQQNFLYIRRRSPAEWMSALMNDVLFLQTRFTDILGSVIRDGIMMCSAIVSLLIICWPLALLLLLISPLVALGMGKTGKRIAYFAEAFQKELAAMASHIFEVRQRFDFIRAQAGEQREIGRWQALNQAYYRMIRRSLLIRAAFAPVMEWLGFLLFAAAIFFFSGHSGFPVEINGENLLITLAALGMLLRPLRNVGEQFARFQETWGALQRSLQVFSDTASCHISPKEGSGANQHIAKTKNCDLFIHHVAVGYSSCPAVRVENLAILQGQGIAIVGPSGSGKSTLLRCLAGLIEPQIWDTSQEYRSWCQSCSAVAQEPFLFEDSLIDNLLYGHPDAGNLSDSDIWEALRRAGVSEDVRLFPDGLNHQIQAVQQNLSGGQIQRLVIARALLRPARVFLLDEATSAIDAAAERSFLHSLLKECRTNQKSLVAVTHRLQCLADFDEIWFLEKGHLVAKGTHATLLLQCSRYREFYGASETGSSAC
ncbi:MAG: ABC transporter ATP-binding protein [Deltaproteobacteria bacterium]|nr:ABC transporter ATP-binding protein [Deltaproteobacteria bacterium]